MKKLILVVLAVLAVACGAVVAGDLDFVALAIAGGTNATASVTVTNGAALRGVVRSVQVVVSGSPNGTGTVTVASVPAHGMIAQTLYPETATAASAVVHPVIQSKVALSNVNDWGAPVLMDDRLALTVSDIATTGTVSITAVVTYERMK